MGNIISELYQKYYAKPFAEPVANWLADKIYNAWREEGRNYNLKLLKDALAEQKANPYQPNPILKFLSDVADKKDAFWEAVKGDGTMPKMAPTYAFWEAVKGDGTMPKMAPTFVRDMADPPPLPVQQPAPDPVASPTESEPSPPVPQAPQSFRDKLYAAAATDAATDTVTPLMTPKTGPLGMSAVQVPKPATAAVASNPTPTQQAAPPTQQSGKQDLLPDPDLLRRIRGINRGLAREARLHGVVNRPLDYTLFMPVSNEDVAWAQEAERGLTPTGSGLFMRSQFADRLQKAKFEQELQKALIDSQTKLGQERIKAEATIASKLGSDTSDESMDKILDTALTERQLQVETALNRLDQLSVEQQATQDPERLKAIGDEIAYWQETLKEALRGSVLDLLNQGASDNLAAQGLVLARIAKAIGDDDLAQTIANFFIGDSASDPELSQRAIEEFSKILLARINKLQNEQP